MRRTSRKKPQPDVVPSPSPSSNGNSEHLNKTHERWRRLFAQLPERQALLYAAEKALEIGGDDGLATVARVTGLTQAALKAAVAELESGASAQPPASEAAARA